MLDKVQSLWMSDALSKMETMCLNSFLKNSHEVDLYVHGPVKTILSLVTDGGNVMHPQVYARLTALVTTKT